MIIYESWSAYVSDTQDVRCKIQRIDKMIDALLLKMAESIESANYKEYQLDDGQTKIRTVYSSPTDIERSIFAMRRLKEEYKNQLTGRVIRLRDGRNFN